MNGQAIVQVYRGQLRNRLLRALFW